jgi:tight adherence protein B
MIALSAGLLAAVAGSLLVGGRVSLRSSLGPVPKGVVAAAGVVTGGGAVVGLLDGTHLVVGLVALGVVAAAGRELVRRRRVADAQRRADRLLSACEGLAADLRAGQPPVAALEAAADEWPELGPAAAAARLGADVPAALRAVARRPGAAQARVVAAAWQVAHRSGAGLAGALTSAAAHLRDERSAARVVATEMAAARATARLLAALPAAVLLLGDGLGGHPVHFLLDTTPGVVCLGAGLGLEYLGLLWLGRIADQVLERRA